MSDPIKSYASSDVKNVPVHPPLSTPPPQFYSNLQKKKVKKIPKPSTPAIIIEDPTDKKEKTEKKKDTELFNATKRLCKKRKRQEKAHFNPKEPRKTKYTQAQKAKYDIEQKMMRLCTGEQPELIQIASMTIPIRSNLAQASNTVTTTRQLNKKSRRCRGFARIFASLQQMRSPIMNLTAGELMIDEVLHLLKTHMMELCEETVKAHMAVKFAHKACATSQIQVSMLEGMAVAAQTLHQERICKLKDRSYQTTIMNHDFFGERPDSLNPFVGCGHKNSETPKRKYTSKKRKQSS